MKKKYGEAAVAELSLLRNSDKCTFQNQKTFSYKGKSISCDENLTLVLVEMDHITQNVKSMTWKQYENMTVFEFVKLPKYNREEFQQLINQDEQGALINNTLGRSEIFSLCANYHNVYKPSMNHKQRKQTEALCNTKIKTFIKKIREG